MRNGWLPGVPSWSRSGVAVALRGGSCGRVGQAGTAAAVYVGVLVVMASRGLRSLVLAAVHAGAVVPHGFLVPGWHPENGLLLGMLTAVLAIFGFQQMIIGNVRLREAHQENQRLAISEERNRFARDLHDILGHSLTVITVKAEFAAGSWTSTLREPGPRWPTWNGCPGTLWPTCAGPWPATGS